MPALLPAHRTSLGPALATGQLRGVGTMFHSDDFIEQPELSDTTIAINISAVEGVLGSTSASSSQKAGHGIFSPSASSCKCPRPKFRRGNELASDCEDANSH
ncbi:hypothetical protein RRF57_005342 [Xylaria bambusicola]|uniref:Uncharacterized protein n=1 Tax=Xylaria bambusicola TaxID=326684 RepID=A0AAN7Z4P5_9PEZI